MEKRRPVPQSLSLEERLAAEETKRLNAGVRNAKSGIEHEQLLRKARQTQRPRISRIGSTRRGYDHPGDWVAPGSGSGTSVSAPHSFWMRKLYFGMAALCGALFLFELWLAQHQQLAAVDRLERYEIQHNQR
jgi:hypothetical protein